MKNSTVRKTILKNGLRVVTVPQQGTKAVTVLVLVGTGSKYEQKPQNGISHFLEHMFFKGTEKRKTPLEVAEVLDEIGGAYNAFTSEEYTGYYAKVNVRHVDRALDWVADILLHSLLPAKEIRKEKGVVIEEINMYRDNPMLHIGDVWTTLLYGNQPAGWNVAGTKKTVTGLQRKDLASYMHNQYVGSNTVVCVAGNIDEKTVLRMVSRLFKNLRAGNPLEKPTVLERQKKPEIFLEYRNTGQTHIALGARAFNRFDERRHAQDLLATVLGRMMSSRLFVEVREKLGLAYEIHTESEQAIDTGWLATFAGLRTEDTGKAVQVILREYKRLAKTLIPERELAKAKEREIGAHILRMESSDARAQYYGMQELLEQRIVTPEEEYATIRAVTSEDCRRTAQEIFRPENLNLAIIGPFRDKKQFEKLVAL